MLDGCHDLVVDGMSNIRIGIVCNQNVEICLTWSNGRYFVRVIKDLGRDIALLTMKAQPLLRILRHVTDILLIRLRGSRTFTILLPGIELFILALFE
jgi:hypothetical protein